MGHPRLQRHDVRGAANILGISPEAVRKRAHRGTLPSEKDEDGHLYVYLDDVRDTGQDGRTTPTQAHFDSLQEQVDFPRRELISRDEELAEMRRIVCGLVQRIPAIEAPAEGLLPEERESPVTASAPSSAKEGGEVPSEARRPWWRRWFGA